MIFTLTPSASEGRPSLALWASNLLPGNNASRGFIMSYHDFVRDITRIFAAMVLGFLAAAKSDGQTAPPPFKFDANKPLSATPKANGPASMPLVPEDLQQVPEVKFQAPIVLYSTEVFEKPSIENRAKLVAIKGELLEQMASCTRDSSTESSRVSAHTTRPTSRSVCAGRFTPRR